jgi:hypothetical protein
MNEDPIITDAPLRVNDALGLPVIFAPRMQGDEQGSRFIPLWFVEHHRLLRIVGGTQVGDALHRLAPGSS